MFKKIIPLALSLSMLIPTIASAETLKTQGSSAKAPYASEITAEKVIIKTNHDTNQAIRVTIKDKLAQIKALIAQNKADKTLKAKKEALKLQEAVLKSDRESLKAMNANLKIASDKVKADRLAKNFASLVTDLQSIPDLQTSKTPVLQKLNSDLDLLITLLTSKS